jgi:glycosyltransferase involved in cell wall biosynthesis
MTDFNISVAMCTFNGKQFLGAQLESIAAQSRLPDQLVICDDGSSDGSVEVVRQFARRAAFPTRLVVNDKNLGSTKNFEKAISLCQGSIIALADQDDVWYCHKLERIEKTFLRSKAIVSVFSDADLIGDDSRLLGQRLWATFSFNLSQQSDFANGDALNVLVKHPVVTGATMAFRKEFFDLLAPIPADHVHDQWISFLLAACGQLEPISEPLMKYRQHLGQQLGPGPLTLREQTARARSAGADFYLEQIARFHQLHERLEQRKANFPDAERAQNEIKRKVSHLYHRARLPHARIARISMVMREALNGGYWRCSAGWKSVAKDLVLR